MLDFIRERAQGWFVKAILIVIAFTFALFGIDSYFNRGGEEPVVAHVGKTKITQSEFNQMLKQARDQRRQQLGANADPALIDTPELRHQVIDTLVNQRLLYLAAVDNHSAPSKAQVEGIITTLIPGFQEDGKFSPNRLQAFLNDRHLTYAQFIEQVAEDMVAQNTQATLMGSVIIPDSATNQVISMVRQTRSASLASLPVKQYESQVKVTDAEINDYYKAHMQDYAVPEQAKVQYAVLSLDKVKEQVQVSDAEIQAYYDSNKQRFAEAEQRRASHILIPIAANATAAQKEAAEKLAQQVDAQAKANPKAFAELAKKYSKDPGSAAQGGDLGYFSRSAMVKPFADAAFGMQVGEISAPVKTQYGLHIIMLTGIKPGAVQPLAAVRSQVVDAIRTEKAGKLFNDLAETFNNVTYEQSESLKPAADKVHVEVQTSDWITRKGEKDPLLGNSRLLNAIFSPDAIKDHRNTAPIEVKPEVLVAAHVIDYKPAATQSLKEVSGAIRDKLAHDKAEKLAHAQAETWVKELAAGKAVPQLKFGAAKEVTRQTPAGLTPPQMDAAFSVHAQSLPGYGVADGADSVEVVRVSQITPAPQADDKTRKFIGGQLLSLYSSDAIQAYVAALKARYPVKIDDKLLASKDSNAP